MAAKKKDPASDLSDEALQALVEDIKAGKATENGTEDQPVDGVFIPVMYDEHGNVGTDVVLNGNVRVTEIQTILELAIKGYRQRIGLDGQAKG